MPSPNGAWRAWYSAFMPEYIWDSAKDERLQRERHISFDDIKYHLTSCEPLGDIQNPNQEQYPGQRLYIVRIGNSAWVVPYR